MGKILVASGEATVGRLIAVLVDSAEAATAFKAISSEDVLKALGGGAPGAAAAAKAPAPAAAAAPAPAAAAAAAAATSASAPPSARTSGSRVVASPYAAALAAKAGISLASLAGTGPGGRIIAADVQEYSGSRGAAAGATAGAGSAAGAAAGAATGAAGGAWEGEFADTPQSGVRRVIAQRLTASKQTVPHYYLTSELHLDALLALRATLNADLPPEGKLSVNDFLIRAAALACKRVPEVNSSWMGDVIRTYDYVDVSLAVAVPSGLITPIVRDAHTKGLSAISR